MLVLPSDCSHLLHINLLGPVRPPAERLLHCGEIQRVCTSISAINSPQLHFKWQPAFLILCVGSRFQTRRESSPVSSGFICFGDLRQSIRARRRISPCTYEEVYRNVSRWQICWLRRGFAKACICNHAERQWRETNCLWTTNEVEITSGYLLSLREGICEKKSDVFDSKVYIFVSLSAFS